MEEYRITIQVRKRAIHDDTGYWGKTDPIWGEIDPLSVQSPFFVRIPCVLCSVLSGLGPQAARHASQGLPGARQRALVGAHGTCTATGRHPHAGRRWGTLLALARTHAPRVSVCDGRRLGYHYIDTAALFHTSR